MPLALNSSRSGCQTASIRVRGGWVGIRGGGAQKVMNNVAAMSTATNKKATAPAEMAGNDHEHGAGQHRRRAVAECGSPRRQGRARSRESCPRR